MAKLNTNEEEKKQSNLLGVDEETYQKTQTPFEASQDVADAQKKKDDSLSSLESLVNKKDIISDSVMNSLNSSFVVPDEVKKADIYLADQLEKIQSGKTSYSDQVRDMIDQIMNREKFSYDVDTDPLFQQALASAMNSGKQAMQDTIGQASALTGGYGSTYATTAGNQAYNSFIEDAYDNLPQYYQLALEAYQAEGDEMYRQYSMLSAEDDKEFNRNVTAYDATSQYRNRVYDEAYNMYRDNKNDAFAMANLQLSEHGQRVSDAYNYYSATSDYSDTLYEREYNSWVDSINMAWKEIEALNSDAWSEKNFDEGVRQYEQNFAEEVRQYEKNYAQTEDHFSRNQEFQATESQKNRDWQSAEAEKERAFTASENAKSRAVKGGSGGGDLKTPTQKQKSDALKAYNEGGESAYYEYLDSLPSNIDVEEIDLYVNGDGSEDNKGYGELPLEQRTYTKTKDTTNWFWGVDNNDVVTDQYGNEFRIDQLPKSIQKELTNLKKGKSYTKK